MEYRRPTDARIPFFQRYKLGQWFFYCPNADCAEPHEASANAIGVSQCPCCGTQLRQWLREEADEALLQTLADIATMKSEYRCVLESTTESKTLRTETAIIDRETGKIILHD